MTEFSLDGAPMPKSGSKSRSREPLNDALPDLGPAGNRATSLWFAERARRLGIYPGPWTPRTLQAATSVSMATWARAGIVNNYGVLFDMIRQVKTEQLDVWRTTAPKSLGQPVTSAHVLSTALGVMAEDTGRVLIETFYDSRDAVRELYMAAAARDLGDADAVQDCADRFGHVMAQVTSALQMGSSESVEYYLVQLGMNDAEAAVSAAGSAGHGLLETYVDGVRRQAATESRAQTYRYLFGRRSDDDALLHMGRLFALEAVCRKLQSQPHRMHRALTTGYLRLLDENAVRATATQHGDPMTEISPLAKSWMTAEREVYPELHASAPRPGTLLALPAAGAGIGSWRGPDLSFGSFTARGAGVSTDALGELAGRSVEDLPLTVGFRYQISNPYTRPLLGRDGPAELRFSRDPDGNIYLEDGLGDAALDWLASYHSGLAREHTAAEREQYAPLGAKKLYKATQNKKIAALHTA